LFCGKCGAPLAEGADRCKVCGDPVSPSNESPDPNAVRPSAIAQRPVRYAGFWLRAVALLIDSIVLGFLTLPILARPIMQNVGPNITLKSYFEFLRSGTTQAIAFSLLLDLMFWLYCAAFESSGWQATPGKKLLGLYVTDLKGNRISFLRASGRFLGKALEQLTLFIGFLMAGFTAKKQALHDMLCGCLVLRKT
jgi:uncharacterized RDD family membrane protein YckC